MLTNKPYMNNLLISAQNIHQYKELSETRIEQTIFRSREEKF